MDKETCLRCGGHMNFVGREQLQKGRAGIFLDNLSNILSGAYEVEVYVCDKCRKMEFYSAEVLTPEEPWEEGAMEQISCPYCGREHDMDDAVCPYCGKRLMD